MRRHATSATRAKTAIEVCAFNRIFIVTTRRSTCAVGRGFQHRAIVQVNRCKRLAPAAADHGRGDTRARDERRDGRARFFRNVAESGIGRHGGLPRGASLQVPVRQQYWRSLGGRQCADACGRATYDVSKTNRHVCCDVHPDVTLAMFAANRHFVLSRCAGPLQWCTGDHPERKRTNISASRGCYRRWFDRGAGPHQRSPPPDRISCGDCRHGRHRQ